MEFVGVFCELELVGTAWGVTGELLGSQWGISYELVGKPQESGGELLGNLLGYP